MQKMNTVIPTKQDGQQAGKGPKNMRIATWNVRRGLVKRENEIKSMLEEEDLDILFLTETDSLKQNVITYNMKGYKTYLQATNEENNLVRIAALVKENCGVDIALKERKNLAQLLEVSTGNGHTEETGRRNYRLSR